MRYHYLAVILFGVFSVPAMAMDNSPSPQNSGAQSNEFRESFAQFDVFTNRPRLYAQGALYVTGLNQVCLGPMYVNGGIGIFPNFWVLDEFSAVCKGFRYYANYSAYMRGVYNNPEASNYINILEYWNTQYSNEPRFYKCAELLSNPITLPVYGQDERTSDLATNAGWVLPDDYPLWDASKGRKFTIDLVDPTSAEGDGQIQCRQFLGFDDAPTTPIPLFGPTLEETLPGIHHAVVVRGDIVSLQGILDGRLTIAAVQTSPLDSLGNIGITGDIRYASIIANPDFKYPAMADLLISDMDQLYPDFEKIQALRDQIFAVKDMLGIYAEGDVIIKIKNLNGELVPKADPMYLDGIVMATGASTDTLSGKFQAEGYRSRDPHELFQLGSVVENTNGILANITGGRHVAGLKAYRTWDFRCARYGQAPPYFPLTGRVFSKNGWIIE